MSFSHEGCCVHAAPLGLGWTLCVMSNLGVHPTAVVDRVHRARRFLTVALRDGRVLRSGGGSDGGGSGAPTVVWAFAPPRR